EAALKMSFHYWRNIGKGEKTRFITLSNSYHGETLGALAVGDVELYKETYQPLLMDVITVPSPDCYQREPGQSCEEHSAAMFAHMERALAQHAHETCAVIVEPLVQCAGYMRMYHPVYLKKLREACDRHGVHLIVDEMAVGFGRTGTLFACEQAGITPDFMGLSKGLTGGYLPMACILTRDEIYQAFYDDYQNLTAFLHSHSYTGNPLACAAGLASLSIFENEPVLENNQRKAQLMADSVAELKDHPHIAEIRQTGMIVAIEMVKNKTTREPYDWRERRGHQVYQYALKNGALLRPLGDVIYFMPPYVINEEEIRLLGKVVIEGMSVATGDES
ncbi:MAG: adenosylmethionine--8-amino-7-oxononanoate transaminase, partial [Gammaproteobacteria bacterium]